MQGAFDDSVEEGGTKLHKVGITNNLLSVFSSFLTDRFCRNFLTPLSVTGLAPPLAFLRDLLLAPSYSHFLLLS